MLLIRPPLEVDGQEKIEIGDLDTQAARKLLGNDRLFWQILKEYYKVIQSKSMLIKELEQQEDWKAYTIEVHALKSASRQIGAMELSLMAANLEKAGKEGDIQMIKDQTDDMLQKYISYIDILKPFCEEEEDTSPKISIDQVSLSGLFDRMLEAVDNLDMDKMEEIIHDMNRYIYSGAQSGIFEELKTAVECIDVDRCEEIIEQWRQELL